MPEPEDYGRIKANQEVIDVLKVVKEHHDLTWNELFIRNINTFCELRSADDVRPIAEELGIEDVEAMDHSTLAESVDEYFESQY